MRIREIRIVTWRHFENISIYVPDDAGLVCVVGANGTGKSHLLELIASCAHRFGLSQGIEIPRGDPFNDPHDLSLKFYLAPGVSAAVDDDLRGADGYEEWDRTLQITSSAAQPGQVTTVTTAGGIVDSGRASRFAKEVTQKLKTSQDVHFLSLDADRAYPKKNINFNEVAQAYEIDWENTEYTRGRSFKSTTTLYDEWLKYFLASENQSGTRLVKEIRQARLAGEAEPGFVDHFEPYKDALQSVLAHVVFTGVDSKKRTLLFDTTGLELSFNQLSGGEREIAFLIGQIDRFGLRQGLFLLDEPELHLNADLIRSWVGYLTGTVEEGQIWLATHSLEAVEAAGQEATFVLERNDETRKVDRLDRLDSRPVLSALSRSVGTPAFSLSRLRFAFVEGEESLGERERFRALTDMQEEVRFMECGSCNEVSRRVSAVRSLAEAAGEPIRVGGVVDRDFRTDPDIRHLENDFGVHVLQVHEIENFYLHPATVDVILAQNGITARNANTIILDASDERAGSWVIQRALALADTTALPEFTHAAKERAKRLTWDELQADLPGVKEELTGLLGWEDDKFEKLSKRIDIALASYGRYRDSGDVWKRCEGKQVLSVVANAAGCAGVTALIRAVNAAWHRDAAPISNELRALRDYLNGL